jgi:hypothetical protein
MKTLLKLAATALLAWVATPALAAPPPTAITIFSERGQPFSLALDGRLLTRPLARQVHLDWLAPGQHWADFSVPTAYGPPLRFRTAVWLQPGLSTNYVLVLRPYGPQLRQVGATVLGGPGYSPGAYAPGGYPPPPSGYYGGAAIPNSSGYGPTQSPSGSYYGSGQPTPSGNQGGYPSNGQYDPRNNRSYPSPNGGQYGNGTNGGGNQRTPGYPSQSGAYPAPNGDYAPSAGVLQPEEAADLADAMRRQPSDEARVDMAKQTLDQNSMRSEELATLLQTLDAEDARIELAEFGYAHITDPQNFNRVYGTFQSNASVREVQQALGIQR